MDSACGKQYFESVWKRIGHEEAGNGVGGAGIHRSTSY
jgi:hypothetical protein